MEKKPLWSGPKKPTVNSGTQPNNSVQAKAKRGDKDGKKDGHAINDQIHAKEVRLVGDNVENGVYPLAQALKIADEMELDLIEISPNAAPPVCRILDYQKFLYQQRKRLKEQKAKSTKVVVKEIRAIVDDRNEKIGRKIRDNELKRIPYMLIVGEKEAENREVSVRKQGEGDKGSMKIATFAALLNGEIEEMMNRWRTNND